MEIGDRDKHPTLPLVITDGRILGPNNGIVGYLNYGEEYLYVCLYENKLIVAEHDRFDSRLIELVSSRIDEKYYYAFKILCIGGVTAVVKWESDVVLVGLTSGYLASGERIWTKATDIKSWPGLKEM